MRVSKNFHQIRALGSAVSAANPWRVQDFEMIRVGRSTAINVIMVGLRHVRIDRERVGQGPKHRLHRGEFVLGEPCLGGLSDCGLDRSPVWRPFDGLGCHVSKLQKSLRLKRLFMQT